MQGVSGGIKSYENQGFPKVYLHCDQSVLLTFEILNPVKLGHAFERTIKTIVPTVIRTTQDGRNSALLHDNCRSVMPADVVKSPKDIVIAAHDNDWFPSNVGSDELTRFFQQVDPADQLPAVAENSFIFQFSDTRICVPGSWNSRGFL